MKKVKLTDYKDLSFQYNNVIYKITSPNNRIYIGQTMLPLERFDQYCKLNCKGQKLLYKSLKKYGAENHTILILKLIPTCDGLDGLLIIYISIYNSFCYHNKLGMNSTIGGNGSRKFSNSFCLLIYLMNKEGKSFREISRIKNINKRTVKNLINRVGVPIDNYGYSLLFCKLIYLLNKSGKTTLLIDRIKGLPRGVSSGLIKRIGMKVIRNDRFSNGLKQLFLRLYESGMNYNQIGKLKNIDRSKIRQCIKCYENAKPGRIYISKYSNLLCKLIYELIVSGKTKLLVSKIKLLQESAVRQCFNRHKKSLIGAK